MLHGSCDSCSRFILRIDKRRVTSSRLQRKVDDRLGGGSCDSLLLLLENEDQL